MDEKILNALTDLGAALDAVAQSLADKSAKSDAGKTLQQIDKIETRLEAIANGVKSIKSDTQEILKNQQTLLKISSDKKGKTELFEASGEKKSKIKDGVGTILMIAAGVLAIGVAFKLIGSVNFLSVIALSIALPLVAMAFEKIAQLKDLKASEMRNLFFVTVSMAASITAASLVMQFIRPITFSQGLTAILIAGTFAAISFGIGKITEGIKKVTARDIIMMPAVLFAVGLSIALASQVMRMIHPISFTQGLTAILIAGTFAIIGFSMEKITKGIKGITPAQAIMMPLILVSFAAAIVGSSMLMQFIKTIKPEQGLTAVVIALTLALMSLALPALSYAVKNTSLKDAFLMTLILPLLATAIWLSSIPLSRTTNVDPGLLLNIVLQSIATAIMAVVLGATIWALNKLGLGLGEIIEGGLSILALAGVMSISSQILSTGAYDIYPSLDWALGVGLSLLAFGLAAIELGTVVMTGIGDVALLAGGAAILGLSGVIIGAAAILNQGQYGNYPTFDWSTGVALSLAAFGLGVMTLGGLIVGSFGAGLLVLAAGAKGIMIVSQAIVDSAAILKTGDYTGGPDKDWAEGISLALGAFAPVFKILFDRGILGLFSKGPSADDFANAITTVSSGIVTAGMFFKSVPDIWKGGPTADWAAGVGGAIGAFAPVFDALSKSSGLFGSGPTPDDMVNAIVGISNAIVMSSIILANGNYTNTLPDGYLQKMSDNIRMYVDLVDYLQSKDIGAFSFIDTMSISWGLAQLADSYDKLSQSVKTLGTALNTLDVEKLTGLNKLTGSIVLMSLMDSDQFTKMMDALEEKAGIFVKVIEQLDEAGKGSTFGNVLPSVGGGGAKANNDDILQVLNSIDSKMSIVANSCGTFVSYINQLRTQTTHTSIKPKQHMR